MNNVKYGLLLFAICAACSGHTENATESTTSSIHAKDDTLSRWLLQVRDNPDIINALNEIPANGNIDESALDACSDSDVKAALAERGYTPVIIQNARDDSAAGLQILKQIPDTGSKFVPANLDEIEKLVQNHAQPGNAQAFSWNENDFNALDKNLRQIDFDASVAADANDAFVQLLKGDKCEQVLPRYCQYVKDTQNAQTNSSKDSSRLDILLTCELTKWAGELRLNYPKNDYKFDRFRPFVDDKTIVSIRKKAFIDDMAKRGAEAAFATIAPPHPQYLALIKSRKTYLDAIAAGGWPAVTAPAKIVDPVVGKSYTYVPDLKKRLRAENYDVDDLNSEVFDQKLLDAINLYRELHQLANKKVVDAVLFRNLAVSPQDRLDTIDLAIQKYRELAVGSLNYYVMVNIPDFHVEVWKDGKRDVRLRIVVGNDNLQRDPVTKKVMPDPETSYPWHPNRTPIQTSKINEIILNPYWNVPARIRIEELEPKLAQNPNYYAENNYEEVNVDNPKLYYVRELPNPKNSLGQVKFMFPNPHNTYLHDTPAKAAFKNPTRAMSHGCMRVQNPMQLAEYLLKNDGQWDRSKVHSILNAKPLEQVTYELKNPVDVDVVYINARVDDAGPVAFLSDVYQYDAVRTGKVVLHKLPNPKPAAK